MGNRRLIIGLIAVSLILAGCTGRAPTPDASNPATAGNGTPSSSPSGALDGGPDEPFVDPGAGSVTIRDGDDWTLPAWVRPSANSGFFSEKPSGAHRVGVHSVDVTWRQVQPVRAGALDRTASGTAQGMSLSGLDAQLSEPGDFWMRVFASAEEWAPAWVRQRCGVKTYGPDYDDQRHLPIWNECVWSELLQTYKALFVDTGLAADPQLRFVYVPGAFTWAEFDYEIIAAAAESGDLDLQTYLAWYRHAWSDLVKLFGEHANKLVFTGEDYPFGPFGEDDDLLAKRAVDAGMGIRSGITEVSNFHLNEAPAYGSRIEPNGHVTIDESLPIHSGRYVVATENECYNDCGFTTKDPYYAVRQSNLKALQLRMNWVYVVPAPSYMDEYRGHWDWVRLSLGKTAETSPDAWAALRDAEDRYWSDNEPGRFADPKAWTTKPYVRNLERWLVQVDEPGSIGHRTDVDKHTGVLDPDNGTASEGLTTKVAAGDTGFVFEVDPRFAAANSGRVVMKITFLDRGRGSVTITTATGQSAKVERTGSGDWRTATVSLPEGCLKTTGSAPRLRVGVDTGGDDLVVRFVRIVKVTA